MSRLLAVVLLLLLAACGANHPVAGTTADGTQLTGVMRTAGDGGPAGEIELTSGKSKCLGHYQVGDGRDASVLITCADGRTGIASINLRPRPWTMIGTLGGQAFTATIDQSRNVKP